MNDSHYHLRVLVVEDEILIRRYIVLLLEKLGCSVVGQTSSGEEAVKLSKETSPQLILMDIRLKGEMDGLEAAKQICSDSNAPILFMSAYDYQKLVEAEHIPNTIGYLKKPVEDYDLESYLKRLLEMKTTNYK